GWATGSTPSASSTSSSSAQWSSAATWCVYPRPVRRRSSTRGDGSAPRQLSRRRPRPPARSRRATTTRSTTAWATCSPTRVPRRHWWRFSPELAGSGGSLDLGLYPELLQVPVEAELREQRRGTIDAGLGLEPLERPRAVPSLGQAPANLREGTGDLRHRTQALALRLRPGRQRQEFQHGFVPREIVSVDSPKGLGEPPLLEQHEGAHRVLGGLREAVAVGLAQLAQLFDVVMRRCEVPLPNLALAVEAQVRVDLPELPVLYLLRHQRLV